MSVCEVVFDYVGMLCCEVDVYVCSVMVSGFQLIFVVYLILSFFHVCNRCRYSCRCALVAFFGVCVDVMVMLSACEVMYSDAGGCGISDVYCVYYVEEYG